MKYFETEKDISIGDSVRVEGNVRGVVVCDFDHWVCLAGYDDWLVKEKMADGEYLDRGVLIKTEEIGMLYYAEQDEAIEAAE